MRPLIVETYSRMSLRGRRRFHWRVRHTSNGEIMASGEAYSDKRDCLHAVGLLFPDLQVVDL